MVLDPFTIAGIFGTVLVFTVYFANQQGRLSSQDWRYPAANLAGAVLILTSLVTAWNLAAAIIECLWAAISIYGLTRSLRRSAGSDP